MSFIAKLSRNMQEIHGREFNHAGCSQCRDFISIVSFLNFNIYITP